MSGDPPHFPVAGTTPKGGGAGSISAGVLPTASTVSVNGAQGWPLLLELHLTMEEQDQPEMVCFQLLVELCLTME